MVANHICTLVFEVRANYSTKFEVIFGPKHICIIYSTNLTCILYIYIFYVIKVLGDHVEFDGLHPLLFSMNQGP